MWIGNDVLAARARLATGGTSSTVLLQVVPRNARKRKPAQAIRQHTRIAAELPCSRVEEPDAFFRCQDVQPDRSMVEVLTAGGDERVGASVDRLVRLKRLFSGKLSRIISDGRGSRFKPCQICST